MLTSIPPPTGHPPVDTHTVPEDWRHRGACRDEDPELFFPVGRDDVGPNRLQVAEAKAVCRRCPVMSRCRAWALATGEPYGVWGGMSADERAELTHKRAKVLRNRRDRARREQQRRVS